MTSAVLSLTTDSGDLVGVQWKRPQLEVIGEAKLGENFRVLLPRKGYEASYFNSRDQVLRKVEQAPDRLVLYYGPLKNEREEVNVEVVYEIRDTGTQLQFSIRVNNDTDRPLAEVLFGIIGGQKGIQQRLDTESLVPGGFYNNLAPRLFSQFQLSGENLGVRFDSAGFTYPGEMVMGWTDIYNRKVGLGYYYANQDPDTRVTALYTEMHPYARVLSPEDNWPSEVAVPPGEPIGLTMGWINFPYVVHGEFRAGPIALQVHEGDWRAAAPLYRSWFDQHFNVSRTPNWLRNEMAWQAVVISNPEDEILCKFKDLPKLAADAKRYGVTTLYILGWHAGGVDRGYPDYIPDPRLGTVEEFRQALSDVRAMGVHPLLFGNMQLADTSTQAFRTRLSRYAVEGRWAPDWIVWGFGEGTIGARNNVYGSTIHRKFAALSPSHPKFREEIIHHYLDRVKDGAEGLHLESAALLVDSPDFNPRINTSPDKSLPQGALATLAELAQRARDINPDFGLSALAPFDRSLPYFDVAHNVMPLLRDAGSTAQRYTFPEFTYTIAADNPEDFVRVNNGLRYGLVWVIAPRQYTDSMNEKLTQPLSRYVGELIRIRKQYADLLFHGRFDDTLGASVSGGDENIRYSVFSPMDRNDQRRASVVVNFGDGDEIVEVNILGKERREATVSAPFQADRVDTLPVKISLPPHGAAVVVAK